tara:strand:- start:1357 stop:2016 length:660 start_codon:yes stop_codon:yes gene_type:complete
MLVELDDLKNRLEIPLVDTSQDVYLNGEIALFSESVENYCNRKFEVASYVEKIFHADFYNTMYHYLYHFPISTITTVVEKAKDETDTILDSSVNNRTGKFNVVDDCDFRQKLFNNTGRNGYIEITYDAGYATIPLEIQESVFSLIEARYNKKQSGVALNFGSNVQRISVPGVMGIDFDYTLSTNERNNKYGMILGDYLNVFDNYRSERTLFGDSEVSFI